MWWLHILDHPQYTTLQRLAATDAVLRLVQFCLSTILLPQTLHCQTKHSARIEAAQQPRAQHAHTSSGLLPTCHVWNFVFEKKNSALMEIFRNADIHTRAMCGLEYPFNQHQS
jgi:hypothetical protein